MFISDKNYDFLIKIDKEEFMVTNLILMYTFNKFLFGLKN